MEKANLFKWIDFYTAFATKLLDYKHDRQTLIEKIKKTFENIGMVLPKLETEGDPKDIDPFTIFGLLNVRSDENRRTITKGLIYEFSIDANVPANFLGAAYNQHLMQPFYSITGNRKEDDIDNLWTMFEIAIEFAENDSMENHELFCKSYDQVQTQWNVAKSLTAVLYWIRPYAYINLDYRIQETLKNPNNLGSDVASKITSSVPSGKKYLDLRDSCLAAFSSGNYPYKSFPELSYKAWTESGQSENILEIELMENKLNDAVNNKKYWLISWNPGNWKWYNYEKECEKTLSGNTFVESWSCTSKKPKIGDEVFLIKLGEKPRGIIGHGFVHRESYTGEHYDDSQAEKGKQSNYIEIEFDRLLNHKTEKILLQDELKVRCPSQTWSPMSSGIEIKPDVVPALQTLWEEVLNYRSDEEESEPMYDDSLFSRNMILYGPPGTGKTYNAVNYAVAICESKDPKDVQKEDYGKVLSRFYTLKNEGRIAFTTFHQSYGYEEFIEGIRPAVNEDEDYGKLDYEISDGIFKKFCNAAKSPENPEIDHNAAIWYVRLKSPDKNDLKSECFQDGEIRFEGEKDPGQEFAWTIERLAKMRPGDFVLSYGGKSVFVDGIGIIEDDEPYYDEVKTSYKWTRKVKWLLKNVSINVKEINGGYYLPNFEISSMSHMNLSDLLRVVEENGCDAYKSNKKPFIFIIDEINRGNISKIFGELITLIEGTKREGADEAMDVILPYSGKRFSVPDNVYILGTMNTADRSIALLDTALRRRFDFIEMMPDNQFLDGVIIEENGATIDIRKMFETMNKRIEILFDREHMIGHAYFKPLKEEPTIEKLKEIFLNRIIPLLQEYFYDDYEKIQLVLGDNDTSVADGARFIIEEEVRYRDYFRGRMDSDDFDGKKIYYIKEPAFKNPASYKKIYE